MKWIIKNRLPKDLARLETIVKTMDNMSAAELERCINYLNDRFRDKLKPTAEKP